MIDIRESTQLSLFDTTMSGVFVLHHNQKKQALS
jgi:hypothetical protein